MVWGRCTSSKRSILISLLPLSAVLLLRSRRSIPDESIIADTVAAVGGSARPAPPAVQLCSSALAAFVALVGFASEVVVRAGVTESGRWPSAGRS